MPYSNAAVSRQTGTNQSLHWRNFVAAPHRMFFFGGVWALVLSVAWWGAALLSVPIASPAPHWLHGWLMVFGALPMFVFGFLFTALPRWLGAEPIAPEIYRPAAIALMAGFTLTLAGAVWNGSVAITGMTITALAWVAGVVVLLRLMLRAGPVKRLHPPWALAALSVGLVAVCLTVRAAFASDTLRLIRAPQIGLWAFLAPMVFVVAHRVLPFFAAARLNGDYRIVRPLWTPPLVVLLLWAHAAGMLSGHAAWLIATDLPLLLITAWQLIRWQAWKTRHEPLLWTLFAAFAWLPVALALSLVQSLALQLCGLHVLGLAPLHALAIGLAASMVFAMATRISMGHAGRALQMPPFAVICFIILQLAAIARVCAELRFEVLGRGTWLALAAALWLCAFTPWALRLSLIYWQPRIDGRRG